MSSGRSYLSPTATFSISKGGEVDEIHCIVDTMLCGNHSRQNYKR